MYEKLKDYSYSSDKSFLKAHQQLMMGLIDSAGKYRKQGVGIVKGTKVEHIAPPHNNVHPIYFVQFKVIVLEQIEYVFVKLKPVCGCELPDNWLFGGLEDKQESYAAILNVIAELYGAFIKLYDNGGM